MACIEDGTKTLDCAVIKCFNDFLQGGKFIPSSAITEECFCCEQTTIRMALQVIFHTTQER